MTFQTWIAELIDQRFETATALAAAVGMKLSPFTRGVAAGTFNLVNLLKLAKATQTPPSMVLRLAGKPREADLFAELYGPEKQVTDPLLQDLLTQWSTFTGAEKTYLRASVTMVLHAHARSESGVRDSSGDRGSGSQTPEEFIARDGHDRAEGAAQPHGQGRVVPSARRQVAAAIKHATQVEERRDARTAGAPRRRAAGAGARAAKPRR